MEAKALENIQHTDGISIILFVSTFAAPIDLLLL
jgi:hypothetical protein